jgi:hypothetical protein
MTGHPRIGQTFVANYNWIGIITMPELSKSGILLEDNILKEYDRFIAKRD